MLCKSCFQDPGLRQMAAGNTGLIAKCPNCSKAEAHLLTKEQLERLAHMFFVRGSLFRTAFGAAPAIQFNDGQSGSLEIDGPIQADVELLQKTLGIGFFHYGPRLWMLGEIEPLKDLQRKRSWSKVIGRIIEEYPEFRLEPGVDFFRVRKAPDQPNHPCEFDAPPRKFSGKGRLDTARNSVLYASQDLEVCIHESRFAAEDELFVATQTPTRQLRLLDLTAILEEELTEFESLDLAVHMLFLAGNHSYPISRAIAHAAAKAGFDGLLYPSYFSMLRTGAMPFETVYGLSLRRLSAAVEYEKTKIISNLALFGHPVAKGDVKVVGINRLVITRANYEMGFGPIIK